MKLNEIRDHSGATHSKKRRGRGIGSGLGKTGGRGHKGQKSRSGVAVAMFEGGQMPIYRRLPRRGFNNPSRLSFAIVNLGRLQQAIDDKKLDAKKPIDAGVLKAAGVIRRELDGVRVLARGELTTKVDLRVTGASKSAVAAVEKAGGSLTLLAPPAATEASERPAE
jgi:large subunit ribosomal protein L15